MLLTQSYVVVLADDSGCEQWPKIAILSLFHCFWCDARAQIHIYIYVFHTGCMNGILNQYELCIHNTCINSYTILLFSYGMRNIFIRTPKNTTQHAILYVLAPVMTECFGQISLYSYFFSILCSVILLLCFFFRPNCFCV